MGTVILFVVAAATACFLASRIYLLFTKGELNVKGVTYSKERTPIMYWITVINVTVGMLLCLFVAVILVFGVL